MEEIRAWLLGVTVCAVALNLLRPFIPDGTSGEAVKFACGLVLLLGLIAPLRGMEFSELSWEFSTYERQLEETRKELEEERDQMLKQSIERRTEEYIAAKGYQASVEAELENGAWLPRRAVLYGERTEEMAAYLARELGITQQEWREGE